MGEVICGREHGDSVTGSAGKMLQVSGDEPGSGGFGQGEEGRVFGVGYGARPDGRVGKVEAVGDHVFEPGRRESILPEFLAAHHFPVFLYDDWASDNLCQAAECPIPDEMRWWTC